MHLRMDRLGQRKTASSQAGGGEVITLVGCGVGTWGPEQIAKQYLSCRSLTSEADKTNNTWNLQFLKGAAGLPHGS